MPKDHRREGGGGKHRKRLSWWDRYGDDEDDDGLGRYEQLEQREQKEHPSGFDSGNFEVDLDLDSEGYIYRDDATTPTAYSPYSPCGVTGDDGRPWELDSDDDSAAWETVDDDSSGSGNISSRAFDELTLVEEALTDPDLEGPSLSISRRSSTSSRRLVLAQKQQQALMGRAVRLGGMGLFLLMCVLYALSWVFIA